MKPIISIKEARKIMGKDAEKLTEEQIEKLISDLDFIAREAIKSFKSKQPPYSFSKSSSISDVT